MQEHNVPKTMAIWVGILFFAVSGWFLYDHYINPEVETIVRVIKEVEDSTPEWKTYRNEEYGFEFNYPNDFQKDSLNFLRPNFLKGEILSVLGDMPNLSVEIYSNPSNLGIQDWYLQTLSNKEYTVSDSASRRSTLIVVDGQDAIRLDSVVFNFLKRRVYISLGKYVVGLETSVPSQGSESEWFNENYDKIVSTFKFIEPISEIDISDWKTYRNEQYGFGFKYPPIGLAQKIVLAGNKIELMANSAANPKLFSTYLVLNIYSNLDQESLSSWFVSKYDPEEMLLGEAYKEKIRFDGMNFILSTGVPVPNSYISKYGPMAISHVIISPDQEDIIVFTPAHKEISFLDYVDDVFKTFQFI